MAKKLPTPSVWPKAGAIINITPADPQAAAKEILGEKTEADGEFRLEWQTQIKVHHIMMLPFKEDDKTHQYVFYLLFCEGDLALMWVATEPKSKEMAAFEGKWHLREASSLLEFEPPESEADAGLEIIIEEI